MLKTNKLDKPIRLRVLTSDYYKLPGNTGYCLASAKDSLDKDENVITSIVVYESDPCKLVFINDNTGKVVKIFNVKNEILTVLVCSTFRLTGQLLLVVNDKADNRDDNLGDCRQLCYQIINMSVEKKSVRMLSPFQMMTYECLRVYNKNWIVEETSTLAFCPELFGDIEDDCGELTLKKFDEFSWKCLGTCLIDSWHVASSSLSDSNFSEDRLTSARSIKQIFSKKMPKGYMLMLAEGYLNYRRSRKNSNVSVLSENMSTPSRFYFMSKSDVVVKTTTPDLGFMLKPNFSEGSDGESVGARLFFPWKNLLTNQPSALYSHKTESLISFSLPGMTDFSVSDSKLYVVLDNKQVYVYENFQSIYDQAYENLTLLAVRVVNKTNMHKIGAAIEKNQPSSVSSAESYYHYDQKFYRLSHRAGLKFAGWLEDFQDFKLPQPDKIIEFFIDTEEIVNISVTSGNDDTILLTTKIKDRCVTTDKTFEYYRFLLIRRNDLLFNETFDEPVVRAKHYRTEKVAADSSVREEAVELLTESGSLLTYKFFPGTSLNPVVHRDMRIERARAASGRTNQSSRVFTF